MDLRKGVAESRKDEEVAGRIPGASLKEDSVLGMLSLLPHQESQGSSAHRMLISHDYQGRFYGSLDSFGIIAKSSRRLDSHAYIRPPGIKARMFGLDSSLHRPLTGLLQAAPRPQHATGMDTASSDYVSTSAARPFFQSPFWNNCLNRMHTQDIHMSSTQQWQKS